MNIFYTQNIKGNQAILDETDSFHCSRVLRMKIGDSLNLIDGKGGFYEGIILESKGAIIVDIHKSEQNYGKKNYYLHVAIAPTKNIDRFEWFLEKATEIGIDEITPLLCQRSERKNLREERLEKILISAIKQSVKAYLPKLNHLTDFNKYITNSSEGSRFIAYCETNERQELIKVKNLENKINILIGPEGDFSPEEIKFAVKNNFLPVSFGGSRLRTETAGIVACQIISDWKSLQEI